MKKSFSSAFLLFLFILLPGVGETFVPQAPHLLHLVMKKIKQPAGLEVYQTRKILNYKDTGPGFTQLNEKLIYLSPSQFRIETISDNMTRFSVESDNGFVRVMDGVIVSREKLLTDLYTDILFYRNYESLLNQIMMAGIDTTKVSIQRYDETICYVIGRPLEKGKLFPGLWIEKDTFLPIKYRVEKNSWSVEFLYSKWQKVSRTLYPRRISIFLDNQLFAVVDVDDIDLKQGFSPAVFDIEHIEQLYPKKDTDPFDENARQVEELDKRMEEFKKLYE